MAEHLDQGNGAVSTIDRKHHFVRLVLPFVANQPAPRSVSSRLWHRLSGKGSRPWLERTQDLFLRGHSWQPAAPVADTPLLPHVRGVFGGNAATGYGVVLELSNDARQKSFPQGGRLRLLLPPSQQRPDGIGLEIVDVNLFLFRSRVGFLTLEVRLVPPVGGEPSLEDLVTLNRFLRRARLDQKTPILQELESRRPGTSGEPEANADPRLRGIRQTLRDLLEPLGKEDEAWTAPYGHRLMGFCFALLPTTAASGSGTLTAEDLAPYLFWLRRGADTAYTHAAGDESPGTMRPFGNIHIGVGPEGAAVLAVENDAEFVSAQLSDRVRTGYFKVFLLALHQRVAAFALAMQVAQSPAILATPKIVRPGDRRQLRRLREDVFDYLVRGWYAVVSNSEHHSDLYATCQRVFQVDDAIREVRTEVEELDEYLHRNQAEVQNHRVNALTFLVTPIALLVGFWGMNFRETAENVSWASPETLATSALITLAYYLTVSLVWRWIR